MQRRTSLTMLALASSAALLAGCGSSSSGSGGGSTGSTTTNTGGTGSNDSSQTPAAELTSAFSALSKASTLTTSIKLGATADQIKSLASSNGSSFTDAEASAIAGAAINVEVQAPSGKTLGDLTNASGADGAAVDFTVSDNGTNFVTLRSVNKTLYLQVDLKDLLNAIGKSSALSTVQSLESNPQFPAFVKALIDGKWVSLPASAAKSLTGGTAGSSSPSAQQETAIISGLKSILTTDVTVTRSSTGDTDVLTLTANARKVATDFVNTITSTVPQAALALGSANPSSVPNKNITLGAQVKGGALAQLSIDLGQFSSSGASKHLPILVNFAQSGASISAPSGAVAVNTQQLTSLFGEFAGGLTGSSGSTG